eukprot:TRINITY_DN3241_c0_g1_i1.p1 TRINITY_DN3241_c0_g1~~TRINITY_DN3241_c0_g1_i1.p1  ORF type:complete len:131 (+),score=2.08 TRINITY_DN3241_c0_g1_i1:87-479(+)
MWDRYLLPIGPLVGLITTMFMTLSAMLGFGIPLIQYIGPLVRYYFYPFGEGFGNRSSAEEAGGCAVASCGIWAMLFGIPLMIIHVIGTIISIPCFFLLLPHARHISKMSIKIRCNLRVYGYKTKAPQCLI